MLDIGQAPTVEGGEEAQHLSLAIVEQLVAPVDRAAQCLLAFGQIARAASENVESIEQAGPQFGGVEQLHASRCELDRQRQSVEVPADVDDVAGVGGGERESW